MAEMLSYAFMQKAFNSTVYLSDCPNARRLSSYSPTIFNANTLSHVSLAGVALGFFLVESNLMTLIVVIVAAIILEYYE